MGHWGLLQSRHEPVLRESLVCTRILLDFPKGPDSGDVSNLESNSESLVRDSWAAVEASDRGRLTNWLGPSR
ncbi:hypothetical protein GCM10027615_21830 [Plantactinospora veratri]